MTQDRGLKAMGQVVQIDEARNQDHLGEMVRGTVEKTSMHCWMSKPIGFARYERSQGQWDTPTGSHERSLRTVAGEENPLKPASCAG